MTATATERRTSPADGMLDDLHTAYRAAVADGRRGDSVHSYVLGSLAETLSHMPGGPEAWAQALEVAGRCVADEPRLDRTVAVGAYAPPF